MEKQDLEKEAQRILGRPIFIDLPERAVKTRKSLLLVSFITIFVICSGIQINPTSIFFGINFNGLSEHIYIGLCVINYYLFGYFIYSAWDGFLEWQIRVTATKLIFSKGAEFDKTEFAKTYERYPNNHRHLSLYSWWVDQLPRIGSFNQIFWL